MRATMRNTGLLKPRGTARRNYHLKNLDRLVKTTQIHTWELTNSKSMAISFIRAPSSTTVALIQYVRRFEGELSEFIFKIE
ncbi:hypothetical protein BOTNAR_0002g00040 [Botryotinia narcissicola]|uniref:Uncharacterized protein n=1 Tax=Botryotinia narcissicola TaxID=278944 RepID=A0A4Z1JFA1_9HELO|nr:hypothetical protein BOTNAR_0002g00040 [Botryotinia narcissicola]